MSAAIIAAAAMAAAAATASAAGESPHRIVVAPQLGGGALEGARQLISIGIAICAANRGAYAGEARHRRHRQHRPRQRLEA